MLAMVITISAEKKAKYVFYFITDGTGVNTVLGAEMYNAEMQGRIGRVPFCMTSFPIVGVASTYSNNSGVTDSAASGSALATGVKTENGALGMRPDLKTPVTSIAVWAKEAGMKVGVASSVTINHATPAAFYAHQPKRSLSYDIAKDMIATDLDFYGGSAVEKAEDPKNHPGAPCIYKEMEKAGYAVAFGMADYQKKAKKAKKMLLVQDPKHLNPASDIYSLPYAIDVKDGEMTIEDILRAEIEFLMRDNKNGFFLMNEIGGKVDWACHGHDGATAFAEVGAVDRCIKIAYEFYKQHPDETLIIVTADHETGGLVLARNLYELHLDVIGHQRITIERLGKELHKMHDVQGDKLEWNTVKTFITENFGFWDKVQLTDNQTKRLEDAFRKIMNGTSQDLKTLYQKDDELAVTVRNIQAECALVGWQVTGHSNGYVPCFAVGVGAERIHGRIDNTEIPKIVANIAGWKAE